MKASELMIGDLVNLSPGKANIPNYVMIHAIKYDNYVSKDYVFDIVFLSTGLVQYNYSIRSLKPIPLTPEILEKNGVEFGYTASEEEFCNAVGCGYPEEKGWCYDEGAGEIKIIFPNETDGGLIRLDDQCADKHLELVFVKPIMVHELQHYLKLVGINKEIIL